MIVMVDECDGDDDDEQDDNHGAGDNDNDHILVANGPHGRRIKKKE